MSRGFTLIELLVVVLIIGILAGVALPQYENAVDKTRLMNFVQMASGVRKAEEAYWLANGSYVTVLDNLDVDYSKTCTIRAGDGSILDCPNAEFDNVEGAVSADMSSPSHKVAIHYCPGSTPATCRAEQHLVYDVYYNYSANPNGMVCTGYTDRGRKLCKTMKF